MPTTSASSSSSAASSPVGPDPFSGGGVPRGPFTSAETAETSSPQSSSPRVRLACRSLTCAPPFPALATPHLLLYLHSVRIPSAFPGFVEAFHQDVLYFENCALAFEFAFTVCPNTAGTPASAIRLPPPATFSFCMPAENHVSEVPNHAARTSSPGNARALSFLAPRLPFSHPQPSL